MAIWAALFPGFAHRTVARPVDRIDFRVNSDAGSSQQNHPRIAVSADGSFVIVWVDWRSGSPDIYLQWFDEHGLPVGTNRAVNDNTAYQFSPAVAVDHSGFYSTVFTDYRAHGYPFN
ncbi:MAG: hypothetical protein ACE5FH_00500, partial [Candidatus Zixiibacteriota bacterium]